MSSKAKKLVKGSIIRTTNFVVNVVGGLVLMPFIISTLGDKQYGFWVLIGTFICYYGLLDFGIMLAVQRFVSRAIGANDTQDANTVVNTSLALYILIGVLVLIISGIVVLLAPVVIKDKNNLQIFRIIIALLSLSLAIGFPMRVFRGMLIAHLRFDINAITEIISNILRIALVLILLKMGEGLLILALVTFFTQLVMHVLTFVFAKLAIKEMVISFKLVSKSKIKDIFNYSWISFAIGITDIMRFKVSSFIIAGFLGLSEVTIYSIALRLTEYFTQAVKSSVGILLPVFSQYEGRNNYEAIRKQYIFTTKICGYVTVLLGGTLILFGREFIQTWMGPSYIKAYNILVILAVANIFSAMQTVGGGLLYGISKHKYFIVANAIEASVSIILSIILVTKFGLYGIAWGVGIPLLLMKLFVQPIYTCKVIELSINKFYSETMVPVVIKSLGFFIIFRYLFNSLIKPDFVSLAGMAFIEVAMFSGTMFYLGLNKYERNTIMGAIRR